MDDDVPQQEEQEDLNSNILFIYFLAFLLMLVFYILPTQIPFLIMNHFGSSGTLTGSIIATAFISNAIGAIAFRKLKQKFTHNQIYIIGMSIIAFGFIGIGLVTNVYFFFLTAPIMGFGGGVLMTNMTAWMLSVTHHTKRIQSSGYLTSALFLGQFFSPILFHPLVSKVSIDKFFIIVGILIFIITTTVIAFKKLKS